MMPMPDNDGNGAPWWIKFIYTFGIPAALSVYLIWLMASRLESKIDALGEQWRVHTATTDYHAKLSESQTRLLQDLYQATLRWCINAAENQMERNACFETLEMQIRGQEAAR